MAVATPPGPPLAGGGEEPPAVIRGSSALEAAGFSPPLGKGGPGGVAAASDWRPILHTSSISHSALRIPHLLFLTALCLLLFTQGIVTRSLWASHEARAAQDAQTMLDTGDWLLPRLFDGTAELQKPAGFYWLVAAVGGLRGGVDEIAVRLPAVLAGLFVVLAVWWWLCRQGRPVAGLVAGACLASAVHFTGTARIGRIDVPLTAAVTGMLLTMHTPVGRRRWLQVLVPGLFGACALLLKGPIGLVLVGGVWGVHWLIGLKLGMKALADATPPGPPLAGGEENRPSLVARSIARRRSSSPPAKGGPGGVASASAFTVSALALAGGSAVLLAAPWFLAAHRATDGDFTRVFFWYHHVNRAFGGATLPAHPWWFYLPRLAGDFLPWTPLALVALWRLPKRDAAARFGLDWLVVMFVILSASRFKRADYLLPAYPGLAVVVGCWAEGWYSSLADKNRWRVRAAFFAALAFAPAAWFGFDHFVTAKEQAERDPAAFARQVREAAPAPATVILFQVENHLLAYQLGRPVRTLTVWEDLLAEWRRDPTAVVVARREDAATLRANVPFPVDVIADTAAVTFRPLVLLRRTP